MDNMAMMRKLNKLSGKLKTYKQSVRRTAHCSGDKFIFENVLQLQRTKPICSVTCAYEYGIPFA